MHRLNLKPLIYVSSGLAILIWLGLIYLTGVDFKQDPVAALKMLSPSLGIVFVLALCFVQWFWRWKIWPKSIVPIPNLNGTWVGHLQSTWISPETNEKIPPIPVALVIDQTFLRCTCTQITKESTSMSFQSSLILNENDTVYLCFSYSNSPKMAVQERSPTHSGTAMLRIANGEKILLIGEYWTSRKTTGDIELEFRTDKKWQSLPNEFTHPNETR